MFFKTETYTQRIQRVSLEIITTSHSLSTFYYSALAAALKARVSLSRISHRAPAQHKNRDLVPRERSLSSSAAASISRVCYLPGAAPVNNFFVARSVFPRQQLLLWMRYQWGSAPEKDHCGGENEKISACVPEKSNGINENPFLISSMQRKSFPFWKYNVFFAFVETLERANAIQETHEKGLFVCCPPIHSFAHDGRLGNVSLSCVSARQLPFPTIACHWEQRASPGSRLILFDSWEIDAFGCI